MTKNYKKKTSVEKHKITGHAVEIREIGGTQQLWIDGERQSFLILEGDKFILDKDFYAPAQESLLEAAGNYLNRINANPEQPVEQES